MGEREQLEQLVAAVYPAARRIARMLCRDANEADDLVQEALLRAIRRPPKPLTEEVMRAWLRTVIYRTFISARRRAAREARALLRLDVRDVEPEPSLQGPSRETMEALASLTPRQRACVVLRYLEDASEHEVARVLGLRHGTVKAHLAAGRARLRALLGAPEDIIA